MHQEKQTVLVLSDQNLCMQILKGILGQCVFQLGVMYALVFHSDYFLHVSLDDPALHGTVVFNTFVLMQLVNQVIVQPSHRITSVSLFEIFINSNPKPSLLNRRNLQAYTMCSLSNKVVSIGWHALERGSRSCEICHESCKGLQEDLRNLKHWL